MTGKWPGFRRSYRYALKGPVLYVAEIPSRRRSLDLQLVGAGYDSRGVRIRGMGDTESTAVSSRDTGRYDLGSTPLHGKERPLPVLLALEVCVQM